MWLQEFRVQPATQQRPACIQASAALASLGLEHACQAVSPDGLLLADLLIHRQQQGQHIALMLEPPSCYARNTGRRRGEAAAVHALLSMVNVC